MIHLFFITTLISGIIQEINTIFGKITKKVISIIYSLGSIFFIFWHEPYIIHSFILGLSILSIVDVIVDKKPHGEGIKKINTYVCLFMLFTLLSNYIIIYFNNL